MLIECLCVLGGGEGGANPEPQHPGIPVLSVLLAAWMDF